MNNQEISRNECEASDGQAKSGTPRTDAVWEAAGRGPSNASEKWMDAVARCLEMELQETHAALDLQASESSRLRQELDDLVVLIDGAYDLVEIYGGGSPYNDKWKKNWMEKARSFGATPHL